MHSSLHCKSFDKFRGADHVEPGLRIRKKCADADATACCHGAIQYRVADHVEAGGGETGPDAYIAAFVHEKCINGIAVGCVERMSVAGAAAAAVRRK